MFKTKLPYDYQRCIGSKCTVRDGSKCTVRDGSECTVRDSCLMSITNENDRMILDLEF